MKYTITKETKTSEVLNVAGDHMSEILANIPPFQPERPVVAMTVGEVLNLMQSPEVLVAKCMAEPLAYKAFGLLRAIREQIEALSAYLKRYEVEQTDEERRAAIGIRWPSMAERVLSTCVRYYGLHSIAEAERMPFSDYIVAYKDEATGALYQRRLNKIYSERGSRGIK